MTFRKNDVDLIKPEESYTNEIKWQQNTQQKTTQIFTPTNQ